MRKQGHSLIRWNSDSCYHPKNEWVHTRRIAFTGILHGTLIERIVYRGAYRAIESGRAGEGMRYYAISIISVVVFPIGWTTSLKLYVARRIRPRMRSLCVHKNKNSLYQCIWAGVEMRWDETKSNEKETGWNKTKQLARHILRELPLVIQKWASCGTGGLRIQDGGLNQFSSSPSS